MKRKAFWSGASPGTVVGAFFLALLWPFQVRAGTEPGPPAPAPEFSPPKAAPAAPDKEAKPSRSSPRLGFSGLDLYKLDWNITGLRVADLNGDGLRDLAIVNNQKAKIEILLQIGPGEPPEKEAVEAFRAEERLNKVPDGSRFRKKPLLTEKLVYGFDVGDLNGDGRADLAFHGDPKELVILFQDKKGAFGKDKRVFSIKDGAPQANSLFVRDVTGDGLADILLLAEGGFYVIPQGEDKKLKDPLKYEGAIEGVIQTLAADFNADGKTDLLFVAPSNPKPLRLRFQQENGRFGPEVGIQIPAPRMVAVHDTDKNGRAEIFSIQAKTGRVHVYELEEGKGEEEKPFLLGSLRTYPIEKGKNVKDRDLAIGDVTGDGLPDVVVSDPGAAQLILYRQEKDGSLAPPEKFPTFQGVRTVRTAALRPGQPESVVVLSEEERIIGVAAFEGGRLTFPRPVEIKGKPVALGLADLDGDKAVDLAAVVLSDDKKRLLQILPGDGKGGFGPAVTSELAKLSADPKGLGLKAGDLNGDGRADLVIFVPFENARVLAGEGGFKFKDLTESEAFQKGLLKDVPEYALTFARPMGGDGKTAMLLAYRGKNFARALTIGEKGDLRIEDQFNARHPHSDVQGVEGVDLDGDGAEEVLLFDNGARELSILRREPNKAFKLVQGVDLGSFRYSGSFFGDFNNDGKKDIVLFGKEEFGILHRDGREIAAKELASFETDIEDGFYSGIVVEDLGGDGVPELILTEFREQYLDILSYGPGHEIKPVLRFKVFEEKEGGRRGYGGGGVEPREVLAAEVTGDSLKDLLFVIHDRILIYAQE